MGEESPASPRQRPVWERNHQLHQHSDLYGREITSFTNTATCMERNHSDCTSYSMGTSYSFHQLHQHSHLYGRENHQLHQHSHLYKREYHQLHQHSDLYGREITSFTNTATCMGEKSPASPTQPPVWEKKSLYSQFNGHILLLPPASPTQPPVWEKNHQLHQHSDLYGREITSFTNTVTCMGEKSPASPTQPPVWREITVQPVNGRILLLPPASPTQQPVWERNHRLHQNSTLVWERNHQLHQHSHLYGREITSFTNTATCMGEKSPAPYSFTSLTQPPVWERNHQLHQHSDLYGREITSFTNTASCMGEKSPASPTQQPVVERITSFTNTATCMGEKSQYSQLMDASYSFHQLHQHSHLYGREITSFTNTATCMKREITVQPVNGRILLLPPASPTQPPVWKRNHQLHQHSDLYGREITSFTNTATCTGEKLTSFTNTANCMGEKSPVQSVNGEITSYSFHQLHQHSDLYGRENTSLLLQPVTPTQPPVWERNHQLHQHSHLYGREITVQPVNGRILLLPPASPTQ